MTRSNKSLQKLPPSNLCALEISDIGGFLQKKKRKRKHLQQGGNPREFLVDILQQFTHCNMRKNI